MVEMDDAFSDAGNLIECLPKLRRLHIHGLLNNAIDLTKLFPRNSSLKSIVVVLEANDTFRSYILDSNFYEEFSDVIASEKLAVKRNIVNKLSIAVNYAGKQIAHADENGIVWQNQLLHWTGSEKNSSDKHFNGFPEII